MIKKIQKYLLVNHPLLWNTKILPLSLILIAFNILFLVLGYANGAIDFSETENNYFNNGAEKSITFFAVISSVLVLITWLIFYLKNNAFKSFYPKNRLSLFKEWLIILIVSFFICSFLPSFLWGQDLRKRNYYTETEAKRRCEIINMAAIFTDGSYDDDGIDYDNQPEEEDPGIKTPAAHNRDYIIYNGHKYPLNSYLNKSPGNISLPGNDSLTTVRVRNWMVNNQKDSIRALFVNYMALVREHKLKTNIDPEKWFEIVYNYPLFKEYRIVANKEKEDQSVSGEYLNSKPPGFKLDTVNKYLKPVHKDFLILNKWYVPMDSLKFSYNKISESWINPQVDSEYLLITFYFSLTISLAVFSYRISTGRSWLTSFISFGIILLITGFLGIIFSTEYVYCSVIILLFLTLFAYFLYIMKKKKGKGISEITINALLWLLPAVAPIALHSYILIATHLGGYYHTMTAEVRNKAFPVTQWLNTNFGYIFQLNILLIIIAMLFFSSNIKKWKGLPEN